MLLDICRYSIKAAGFLVKYNLWPTKSIIKEEEQVNTSPPHQ